MKKMPFLLLVLLAVFLIPSGAFACGNSSKKMTCTKEMSSKTGMKDCCSKDSHSKSKSNKGCNGKCGHSLCGVSSVTIGIVSSNPIEIKNNLFNFSTKKQQFYQSVSFTSAGYSTIWLIPKIS